MKFTTYIGNRPMGRHDCSDWEVATVSNGLDYIEGWIGDNQYIENGAFVDRPSRTGAFSIWDWDTLSWQDSVEMATEANLAKRKELLLDSDWTQLPDVPLETKTAWATYRQELRDITSQAGYPLNVVWPTPPQ